MSSAFFPLSVPPLNPAGCLNIRFGPESGPAHGTFPTRLRLLGGQSCEVLFATATPAGRSGAFALFRDGEWLLGCGITSGAAGLEAGTIRLYDELIKASRDYNLCRIWNYVPEINATGPDGQENYHTFSRGRSLAFERSVGPEFKRWLPAASAVGCPGNDLLVVFAANRAIPVHRENPRQIPAYEYPPEHGPRAPSFARASIVPRADGRRDVFISGTSAILGHATVAPGDTTAQTRCTLDNLRAIGRACGLAEECGAGAAARHLKVYLRHGDDLAAVRRELEGSFLQPTDLVSYLVADICRAALNVEIEVTIFGANAA